MLFCIAIFKWFISLEKCNATAPTQEMWISPLNAMGIRCWHWTAPSVNGTGRYSDSWWAVFCQLLGGILTAAGHSCPIFLLSTTLTAILHFKSHLCNSLIIVLHVLFNFGLQFSNINEGLLIIFYPSCKNKTRFSSRSHQSGALEWAFHSYTPLPHCRVRWRRFFFTQPLLLKAAVRSSMKDGQQYFEND